MKTNNTNKQQSYRKPELPTPSCSAIDSLGTAGKPRGGLASTSCVAQVQDRVGKAIDEWNRGSRSMGIGLRSVDRRGHRHPPYESSSRSRGVWLGQRVLGTWDCGQDGMKLVLEGGREVALTFREFYAWSAGASLANA